MRRPETNRYRVEFTLETTQPIGLARGFLRGHLPPALTAFGTVDKLHVTRMRAKPLPQTGGDIPPYDVECKLGGDPS